MTNKIFILTESIDEGIVRLWHFQVDTKQEMAQQIIAHLDHYADMFNGISWYSGLGDWRKRGPHTPETLLQAISDSHIDGDSESRFQIHCLDLANPDSEVEDVTWTEVEDYK